MEIKILEILASNPSWHNLVHVIRWRALVRWPYAHIFRA